MPIRVSHCVFLLLLAERLTSLLFFHTIVLGGSFSDCPTEILSLPGPWRPRKLEIIGADRVRKRSMYECHSILGRKLPRPAMIAWIADGLIGIGSGLICRETRYKRLPPPAAPSM